MRSDYERKWYPLPLCKCGAEAVVKLSVRLQRTDPTRSVEGDKVICPKCYLKLKGQR